MVEEITAKVLLSHVKQPDDWFGLKYNMNLYRGCQHQCIYCDSRSLCYGIEDFAHIQVKANAIDLLRRELAGKRMKGTIGTGSMNDPYMSIETKIEITRRALEVIAEFRFPIHILTKGDLVLRDIDLLERIGEVFAAVSFTITTADDALARKLEPGAASPTARYRAMRTLADHGILTGVTMMPILPFIEDGEENITEIVQLAHENGASYIIPAFGMTLRDRQRAYYYDKLDKHFPGMRQRYIEAFGNDYFAPARNYSQLERHFKAVCKQYKMPTRMPQYQSFSAEQLSLF
jgi:DNA repair photolyase